MYAQPTAPLPSSVVLGTAANCDAAEGKRRPQCCPAAAPTLILSLTARLSPSQGMGKSIGAVIPASEQPAPGILSIDERTKAVRKSFPSALAVE